MKTLATFLPFILPHAPGCPKSVARQALIAAAIDFCEQTNVVQRTLDPFNSQADVWEYDLPVPRHQAVAQLLKAWFKGSLLQVVPQASVSNVQAYRDDVPDVTVQEGDPGEIFPLGANRVGVFPRPTDAESDVFTVRAAMKPTRSATQLEDVLYEDWVEVLAAGALARLHATGGQSYTDQTAAARRETEFRRGINRAKSESARGRVQGDLRVQMRPFA